MALTVYNTASRAKEPFVPLDPEGKQVKMYVCGVTVYDAVHVGHARCYVAFDVIRRYLDWSGYDVQYIQNFTDVDDRIIKRSNELNIPAETLAQQQIDEYFADTAALNIQRADAYPKATEHIQGMIELINDLIDKGFAYQAPPGPEALEGSHDVYFEVEKAGDRFGTLTNQSIEEMQAGARVEVDERKRHPADFALWKGAKPDEPSWESPWGPGRPGWHIECSAMSLAHLGQQFDIHGGGRDLIFPHHEAEILQSESHTGAHPVVRYWLHNGFVKVDAEKMSKSLGNFFTLKDILGQYDPMVIRFFLLNTHYRSPIEFSDAQLEEARTAYERLANTHRRLNEMEPAKAEVGGGESKGKGEAPQSGSGTALTEAISRTREEFQTAMDDDFNTREALAGLFELVRLVNRAMEQEEGNEKTLAQALETLDELGGSVLGLFAPSTPRSEADAGPWKELSSQLVDYLMELREQARTSKDWATADNIRDRLKELGIVLEDTAEGPKWRKE